MNNVLYYYMKLICIQCKKEFSAKPSEITEGRKFCSRKCYHNFRSETSLSNHECEICKTIFEVHQSDINRGSGKYCSLKCAGIAKSMKPDKKITCICLHCKNEFRVKPSQLKRKRGRYCSKTCLAKSKTGTKNPNYVDGQRCSRYCEKWTPEFRERIRAFFGYRCIACGMTQLENGNKLNCHHVAYNRQTCCDESIPMFAPLCNHHHAMTNGKNNRKRWQYMLSYIIQEVYDGKSFLPKEN
jgi:hypothetical protein